MSVPSITMPLTVVLVDSLKIAVVAFCISLSMAKALDKGHVGSSKATRELVADVSTKCWSIKIQLFVNFLHIFQGFANIFGSLFQCVPSATSMSRSFVQVQIQGRTQLTGLVSALVLMAASMTISRAFEPLPKAVLAAIILACLKGAFKNFGDFAKFYSNSKSDGVLWMLTMMAVVLTTPDLGMFIGVAMNICSMAYRYCGTLLVLFLVWDMINHDQNCNCRAHDASFNVTHGKLAGGSHVIKASGTIIFSNVERLLDKFVAQAEKSLQNSVIVIDLTQVHYLDQISAKVLSNGLQHPSIKSIFIVCCKGNYE